jgi:serine/threonine protein kinase
MSDFLNKLDIKEGSFSDYEEEDNLGQGLFGVVHKVRRIKDGKYFAMKTITWNNINNQSYNMQFTLSAAKKEAQILSTLKHKYIISFEDAFVDLKKNKFCLVMELGQSKYYKFFKSFHSVHDELYQTW